MNPTAATKPLNRRREESGSKRLFVIAITAVLPRVRHNVVHGARRPVETKEEVMNTTRNKVIAALGFALLALPSTALAEFKPSAELRSACMSDAFKLCSASLFSMDSVVACLLAKKSEASPQCQAKYDAESKTAAQR
jgi:hypothetical protein